MEKLFRIEGNTLVPPTITVPRRKYVAMKRELRRLNKAIAYHKRHADWLGLQLVIKGRKR